MNHLIESELPGEGILRDQLLDLITDAHLAYRLPGHNLTLSGLIEEMGLTEQVYIQSYKTFRTDWSISGSTPAQPVSVTSLKAWFEKLDAEFVEALSAFSEDDLQNREIERGHGFNPSLFVQFQIYHEAMLIFYAKASIYLKALEIPLPDDWRIAIG